MRTRKITNAVALLALVLMASVASFARNPGVQEYGDNAPGNPCDNGSPLLPWPMFRHDVCHTAVSSLWFIQGKIVGAVQLKGTVSSSPALGIDFRVFATPALIYIAENRADSAKLHAIQTLDGKDRWSADLGENGNKDGNFPLVSSPALNPGGSTVYVGTAGGTVFAFDAATGKEKWNFPTSDDTTPNVIVSSPVVSSDGKVVYIASIGNVQGYLWALDAVTGVELWKKKEGSAYSSPVLSPDGKTVYVSSRRNIAVVAFDAANGDVLWGSQLEKISFSSPAVSPDGKVLYVGDDSNSVYGIDADPAGTGKQLWKTPLLPAGTVRSSPAISPDGYVYVGSSNKSLHKLRASDGKLPNLFTTQGAIVSSPALVSQFLICVGSDDKKVYGVEAATMKEV
jgi:outer membrane protein assembly factor BamB